MARTVTDTAILLTAIAGPDPADPDGLSLEVFAAHPAGEAPHALDYTRFLGAGRAAGRPAGRGADYFGAIRRSTRWPRPPSTRCANWSGESSIR